MKSEENRIITLLLQPPHPSGEWWRAPHDETTDPYYQRVKTAQRKLDRWRRERQRKRTS
ncbi:MAG: hypothetical protein AAGH78_00785 [Cyanobacteria bacterium P01_H01_bin.58]